MIKSAAAPNTRMLDPKYLSSAEQLMCNHEDGLSALVGLECSFPANTVTSNYDASAQNVLSCFQSRHLSTLLSRLLKWDLYTRSPRVSFPVLLTRGWCLQLREQHYLFKSDHDLRRC